MASRELSPGMKSFLVIWFGQVVSVMGSALTSFVLGVWVFQQTGSVTQYSLILMAALVPGILLAPLAGVLVDRWDRRSAMILSDSVAAAVTLIIAGLFYLERLEGWHLYILLAIASLCRAVQTPAYTAATTLLVPKEQFARANGMIQTGQALSLVVGPGIAGVLMATIGVSGVILVDMATFLVALITLLLVKVPAPPPSAEQKERQSMLADAAFGWTYIRERPGLIGLLTFFALVNFSLAMIQALITPMILSFTTPVALGTILSLGSLGMLAGGIVMSTWGGPSRKIHGVLGAGLLLGVALIAIGLRPSAWLVTSAFFVCMACAPFINASSQAIWQSKTPPDLQGRVFAIRMMIAWSCMPLGYLISGPLADRVFEPLLRPGGGLADSVGRIIGAGQGRGIAFLFMLVGILPILASVWGYLAPRVKFVEQELPDQVPERSAA